MSAMFSARTFTTRAATLAATAALPLVLVACASDEGSTDKSAQPGTSTTTATSTSSASSSETTTSSSSSASSTTTGSSSTSATSASGDASSAATSAGVAADKSATPTTTSARSTQANNSAELPESVENAYEIFGDLVPRSLFEEFDSCEAVGMQSYYNCTGSVGQFQFTESKSKAVSTLQTLTELRTSQVVDDSGERVVGWSSLGSTAIITVVNTESGLVMQHMISADAEEPEQKIKELGLVS
ncbi:beta-N-acetylglucosaminidase [Corynebacterium propinquum]|nr:beta-N-acetylglucosaminidase [Corynebacterium propinquum]MDK8536282.1 beta-N-acetylglucosaminidase [Corynebacterium propinquum]UQV60825.1 beta-N-acetylglucosaminidase [Corynebacterium propinquum]WKS27534.1 beta-N-acetylglucosaminidase [Corynebacterium propinquum]